MSRLEDLLEILEESSEKEVMILSQMEIENASKSRSVLLRCRVCDAVIHYPDDFAQDILLTLLKDRNAEVRASAACYLEYYSGEAVKNALQQAFFQDKDPYVRGYGGYSLLKIAATDPQIVSTVENALLKERNLFVCTCCYGALYLYCRKKSAFQHIVHCFKSKNYRTRCAVGHTLMEILNTENASEILKIVDAKLKIEDAFSVQDTLERLRSKALAIVEKNN